MKRVVAFGIVFLGVVRLAGAQGDAKAMSSEVAVRSVLDAQVDAWNRGDLDAFLATYWNSPDLVFQSGATRTHGWQAMRERYRRRYQGEGKEMGRLRFDDIVVSWGVLAAHPPDPPLAPRECGPNVVRTRWRGFT